jgi:hypothetical protein
MMDDEEMFVVPLPRIMVFTVAVVLCFALYGAASAGRDIVALYLRLQ